MKPTNKHQKMIIQVDKSLKPIGKRIKNWAYKNCLTHAAVRLKSGKITCLDCGGSWQGLKPAQGWQDDVMGPMDCPHCHTSVAIETTMKKNFMQNVDFTVIDEHQGYQVIRTFEVRGNYTSGKVVRNNCFENSRIYITPEGKYEIIGHNHQSSYYGDRWWGEFSLKQKSTIHAHTIHADFYYPIEKIIPEITRNGYKGDLCKLTPWTLFNAILNDNISETLLKIGQLSLLYYRLTDNNKMVNKYWNTLKVCFKNNYVIENANDYFDYLQNLEEYGKDLKSPRYVCPKNFAREHDRYVERKRKARVKQTIADNLKKIKEDEKLFKLRRTKFFGLKFIDKNISVRAMNSVLDVIKIGDELRHCIYSSNYHRKENSLLLVAEIDGKPIETIEVWLNQMKINQSRGFGNKSSKYHKRIVDLVEANLNQIQEILKPKPVRKFKTQKVAA